MSGFDDLARLGVSTVHEALGRTGLIDADLIQVVPGSRAAGPARTVRAGQGDNLMVHAALSRVRAGEVLVLTMPTPAPVALLGELIAVQALYRQVAAVLVDAAVRDVEQLTTLGLPVWARWVRATGATKDVVGSVDEPVMVGGTTITAGDVVVLDADGAVVVPRDRVEDIRIAAGERERREDEARAKYRDGALAYDLNRLREKVEVPRDGDASQ